MVTKIPPLCMFCKHYNRDDNEGFTCAAFPEAGIPTEILDNELDHRKRVAGDHGILFEATQPVPDYVLETLDETSGHRL